MPEQPAAAAAHNFKSVKDVELAAKTRMEKSIADMQHHRGHTHRSRVGERVR
jgi:hypothetical protein